MQRLGAAYTITTVIYILYSLNETGGGRGVEGEGERGRGGRGEGSWSAALLSFIFFLSVQRALQEYMLLFFGFLPTDFTYSLIFRDLFCVFLARPQIDDFNNASPSVLPLHANGKVCGTWRCTNGQDRRTGKGNWDLTTRWRKSKLGLESAN